MYTLTKLLVRHRRSVLFTALMITLFFLLQLPKLRIDGSFSAVLPESDPDYRFHLSVEQEFGATEQIIVLIRREDGVFQHELIDLLLDLQGEIPKIIDVDADDIITPLSLGGITVPEDSALWSETLRDLEDFLHNDPLLGSKLINKQDSALLVTVPVSSSLGLSGPRLSKTIGAFKELLRRVGDSYPDYELLLSGHPAVNAEIMERMANDLYLLFPLALLLTALMLLLILRSIRGMLIPLLISILSLIWTFGLKGLLHSPLTITETVIPVILISISCADGIHIVSEAFHHMHHGKSAKEAIELTISHLWKPVGLTSITTALGFASFIFSGGQSLRNTGSFLAFGVMTAMIFSLFLIPVLFSWYAPAKSHASRKHYSQQLHLLRIIEHRTEALLRHRFAVLGIALVMLTFSIYAMFQIRTDTDEIRYFRPSNPVRQTAELIEQEMGGLSVLQIVLEGESNSFSRYETVAEIDRLSRKLSSLSEVSSVVSMPTLISYLSYRIQGKKSEAFQFPESEQRFRGLLTLLQRTQLQGGFHLDSLVNKDYSRTRMLIRLNHSSTQLIEKILSDIDEDLNSFRDQGFSLGYAGDYIRLSNGRVIVRSQVLSLGITLLVILIILTVLYRSLLHGLMVSIPVMLAVLFNFTLMWLFDISLNPATAIISAVGLGVGIDYSIHLYSRYLLHSPIERKQRSAVVHAVVESSRGILSNAMAVGLGFLVLLFSVYSIINEMGWIIASTMLSTALSSLILLPVLLSFGKRNDRLQDSPTEPPAQ